MYVKNKREFAFVYGFFSFFLIFCIVGLFICINDYVFYDLDYSDLNYEELTFEKCVVIKSGKGSIIHEIYFEEYEEPFCISSIVYSKINLQALNAIEENTKTEIYYQPTYYSNYTNEIHDMKYGSAVVLSLDGFIEVEKKNLLTGIVTCSILGVMCFAFVFSFLYALFTKRKNNIGRLRIEYKADGNIIQVYNSLDTLSLVINGMVVDEFIGLSPDSSLRLKGKAMVDGKEIAVELKIGHVNAFLLYDGQQVAKKFMAFG